jgi:predicted MFS family arabinose efflux permease
VALNTSWLYIGQAIGAGLGGELFARAALLTMGYAAAVFMVACFVTAALTRDR